MRVLIRQNSYTMTKTRKILIWISVIILLTRIINGYYISYKRATAIRLENEAREALQAHVDSLTVPELITYLAPENAQQITKVAWCESMYDYDIKGDGGAAHGILQFHRPTFDMYAKKMGEELNYESSYDQIKVANYMWEKNQQHQWTCFGKVYPHLAYGMQ